MDELRDCFSNARIGFGWCALQGLKFDAASYPRTYYPKHIDRLFKGDIWVVLGIIALLGAVGFLVAQIDSARPAIGGLSLGLIVAFWATSSVLLMRVGRRADKSMRLVLWPDRIEYKTFTVPRQSIKRVKFSASRAGRFLIIESETSRLLSIPDIYGRDVLFFAWFSGYVADVDQMRKEIASVCTDPRLGDNAEQRLRASSAARRLAITLTLLSFSALIFAAGNNVISQGVVFACPWLLLVLSAGSRGRLTLTPRLERPLRGNLLLVLIAPCFSAMLAATGGPNVHGLSHGSFVLGGLLLGVLWAKIAMAVSPKEDKEAEGLRWLFGMFGALLAGLISVSAAFWVNRTFDHAQPIPYSAEILQKYTVQGKSVQYRMRLGPWGPQTLRDAYPVTPWLYSRLAVGDSAQIWWHPGLLGQPWFEIAVPDGVSTSPSLP